MNTPVGTPEVKTPKVFSEMICYKVGRPTGAQSVAATFINAPLPSTLADVIARNPKVTEENFTASFVANTNADATNSSTHQRPIPSVIYMWRHFHYGALPVLVSLFHYHGVFG